MDKIVGYKFHDVTIIERLSVTCLACLAIQIIFVYVLGGLPPTVSAAAAFNVGALAAGYAACAAAESNHHSLYAASTYSQPYFPGLSHPGSGTDNSANFYHSLVSKCRTPSQEDLSLLYFMTWYTVTSNTSRYVSKKHAIEHKVNEGRNQRHLQKTPLADFLWACIQVRVGWEMSFGAFQLEKVSNETIFVSRPSSKRKSKFWQCGGKTLEFV